MIRKALMEEFDAVRQIYAHARAFMAANGNPDQWGATHPTDDAIRGHIDRGELYAVEHEVEITGVFAFIPGADPTYAHIDGAWHSDAPYAAIHCVASSGKRKGMFTELLEFCEKRCGHLRIDTYKDNHIMQRVVTKHGFRYCGTICLADGSPRMAYDKLVEIWDGYLADGNPAGRDLVRGQPIPEGLCHLVSEILVRHTDGDYLLMQRDFTKPNFGGYFEATAGGSALKGEDALACAKRELLEETGISGENLTHIGVHTSHDTIYHMYLCVTDCDKTAVTLQEGETVSYRWIPEREFAQFVNSEQMIPVQRMRQEAWLRKMGYIGLE